MNQISPISLSYKTNGRVYSGRDCTVAQCMGGKGVHIAYEADYITIFSFFVLVSFFLVLVFG